MDIVFKFNFGSNLTLQALLPTALVSILGDMPFTVKSLNSFNNLESTFVIPVRFLPPSFAASNLVKGFA